MFASIVFRNIGRNRKRLLPLIIALTVTFLVLVLGNGILASSGQALRQTFTEHVSGDLSVSATADNNFTLFGSDSLLIGEYQVPPTLLRFEELRDTASGLPGVAAVTPAISAIARVEVGSNRHNRTVLGVDFERYRRMFPELEVVDGDFPEPGERAIMVQPGLSGDVLGETAVLSAAHDFTFALREATVSGVFRYPVDDDVLNRVVLTDPETARALNGYVYGAGGVVDIPEAEQELFERDVDDLFAEGDTFGDEPAVDEPAAEEAEVDEPAVDEPAVDDAEAEAGPSTVDELEAFFRESREEAAEERGTAEGAWNFLLLSLADGGSAGRVEQALREAGFTAEEGFEIRDWRRTVGGNAQIAWYLQLMFNVGVLFVAVGAVMITTNALVLSVLERTGEIGTMRALGATRLRVAAMIVLETFLVVVGSALVGILLGLAVSGAVNAAEFSVDNPYIDILFGGRAVSAHISPSLIAAHLLASAALALVAVVYPLKRALGIAPVEAMAE